MVGDGRARGSGGGRRAGGPRGGAFALVGALVREHVVRRGRVRRAKLYYLRHLTGKATRIRERKAKVLVPGSDTVAETGSGTGVEA